MKADKHSFRHWVHEQWLQNRDELESYNQRPRSQESYWQEYRWWLRSQYRQQREHESA